MKSRLVLERPATGTDDSGQPLEGWTEVDQFRARRMKVKGEDDAPNRNDQEREKVKAIFRARSQKVAQVQSGDRLRELPTRGTKETIWDITSVPPVEEQYTDLLCERVS